MIKDDIKNIPKYQTVTYEKIVADYFPQKADPNRIRITAGGNLINYPEDVTTRTAYLITTQILRNIVLSNNNEKYCCTNFANFYLETSMDWYEYMRTARKSIPDEFINDQKLHDKVHEG